MPWGGKGGSGGNNHALTEGNARRLPETATKADHALIVNVLLHGATRLSASEAREALLLVLDALARMPAREGLRANVLCCVLALKRVTNNASAVLLLCLRLLHRSLAKAT